MGLSVEEVSGSVGVGRREIERWEEGLAEPSVEQLWELAELYGRGTDYFLKDLPPAPAGVSFRLLNNRTMEELSIEARRVIARFEELCRAAYELEQMTGTPRNIAVVPAPHESNSERLAQRERQRFGANGRPIRDLRSLLEKEGVLVFELSVAGSEFSGFSWWHSHYGPCIMVNARDGPGRRAFTLAHEYAHILHEHPPHVCDPEAALGAADERFANGFAVAFLMPASDVLETFETRGLSGTSLTYQQLGSLASRYNVSLHAMAIRLEELRLVPSGATEALEAQWEAAGKYYRRGRTPAWKRRLGKTYVSLASNAYAQGHISVGKLAEYLGLSIREAMTVAQEGGRHHREGN
jgi:Zn-dependent peptidase ImmA (M78 family)